MSRFDRFLIELAVILGCIVVVLNVLPRLMMLGGA